MQSADRDHTVFYACKYTPLELLRGFGAKVKLAEANVSSFDRADSLAHANLCGYGKGLIERLLQPDVHEVVLVSCCDVVRRVYDVMREEGSLDFLYLLDLPHKTGAAERALLRARLAELADAYASHTGTTFDPGRALAGTEPVLPRCDRRVTLMGAHASKPLLDAMSMGLGCTVENATCTGPRSLPAPPPELARAVSFDICSGCDACGEGDVDRGDTYGGDGTCRRGGSCVVDENGEGDACSDGESGEGDVDERPSSNTDANALDTFLDWYAGALLSQTPCMRMDDVSARDDLVATGGQRGVVYHTMKFCDYYGFEYGELARQLEVPMVKIETDGTSQSAGQLRTRLEAFGETLRGSEAAREAAHTRVTSSREIFVMGVDSGSTSTDAVVINAAGEVVASVIIPTGARASESAARAKAEVLQQARLGETDMTLKVATGYGRDAIPDMDTAITEITCHARGAHALAPDVRSVIDIGGQDSKVIHLSPSGEVLNFVMNDKCAAGTGRFMEAMARVLEMPLDEFCRTGLAWRHNVKISSMCTVFAESEVVSLVAEDTPVADIIHGLDESVARKTATLAHRVNAEPPYLMTGGVAQNEGVVKALEDVLGAEVRTHPESQLCGAFGAALLGLESLAD